MFDKITDFEKEIAEFTGAPFAITTDCCTHAIELCLRLESVRYCKFTAFTYVSVLMTMHKLGITYDLTDESWEGEYKIENTRIWDSARLLSPNMYRTGQLQCLSFGYTKPLDIGRGGAILTDDETFYEKVRKLRYDGRDLSIAPWIEQKKFNVGFHYKLNPEECMKGSVALKEYISKENFESKTHVYPDCRTIEIVS